MILCEQNSSWHVDLFPVNSPVVSCPRNDPEKFVICHRICTSQICNRNNKRVSLYTVLIRFSIILISMLLFVRYSHFSSSDRKSLHKLWIFPKKFSCISSNFQKVANKMYTNAFFSILIFNQIY